MQGRRVEKKPAAKKTGGSKKGPIIAVAVVGVVLAAYLGLRRSEILGLRWRDVDLQSGLLSVRQVRTTIGHQVVEKEPKTNGSRRTLSISSLDNLLGLLRRLFQRRTQQNLLCTPDDLLVLDSRNQPWHPNSLTTTFTDFTASHGLPPLRFTGCGTPSPAWPAMPASPCTRSAAPWATAAPPPPSASTPICSI